MDRLFWRRIHEICQVRIDSIVLDYWMCWSMFGSWRLTTDYGSWTGGHGWQRFRRSFGSGKQMRIAEPRTLKTFKLRFNVWVSHLILSLWYWKMRCWCIWRRRCSNQGMTTAIDCVCSLASWWRIVDNRIFLILQRSSNLFNSFSCVRGPIIKHSIDILCWNCRHQLSYFTLTTKDEVAVCCQITISVGDSLKLEGWSSGLCLSGTRNLPSSLA